MIELALAAYILLWPAVSMAVLLLIVAATLKEFRKARETGNDVV